jgi:hypothetical protein
MSRPLLFCDSFIVLCRGGVCTATGFTVDVVLATGFALI